MVAEVTFRLLALAMLLWASPVWATQQVLLKQTATPSVSAVRFFGLWGSGGANATETNRMVLNSPAGVLKNLSVSLSADPANGALVQSYAFMVMVNASTSVLTCTVSEGATTCTDTTNEAAIAAGSRLTMRVTPANTPAAVTANWTATFVSTTQGETLISGGTGTTNIATGATNYLAAHGIVAPQTDESLVEMVVPTTGTLKNLYVQLSGSPNNGAGTQTYGFTVRRGTSAGAMTDTTITCPISEAATTCNDTSNSITLAVGDRLTISSTIVAGTPTARLAWYGLTFLADVDGQFLITANSNAATSTAATSYLPPQVVLETSNATETTVDEFVGQAFVITGMAARSNVAPDNGAGTQTWDFTLNIDTVGQSVTCPLSETTNACSDSGDSVVVAVNTLLATKIVPANTPAATSVEISYVGFLTPRREW